MTSLFEQVGHALNSTLQSGGVGICLSEVRRNNDCIKDSSITKPEALEWVSDTAGLNIAIDFRLSELQGKVESFF
jgi:hypothetical protein